MSSFTKLSDPKLPVDETSLPGWDETVEGAMWQNSDFRATAASHAIADQNYVCGIDWDRKDDWITWTKSFAPNRVCCAVSNSDGSIVAVATDAGGVAILRGIDGNLIASRRVASEGVRTPAGLSFIGGKRNTCDALLIEPPEEDKNPIIVMNINGDLLSSDIPGRVAEATRNMASLELHLQEADNRRSLTGCFHRMEDIRFAMIDGDGKLAVEDYNLNEKTSTLIKKDLAVVSTINGRENVVSEVDYNVGVKVQALSGTNHNYLVMSTYRGKHTSVSWFDLEELNIACEYGLSQYQVKRLRVEALEPLSSCDNESALAVAIASKPSVDSSTMKIEVVQVLADSSADGSSSLSSPHVIYSIPMPQSVRSVSIAPIPSSFGPYSFLCKSCDNDNQCEYRTFRTLDHRQDGTSIGNARLLVQRKKFDEAQKLVDNTGERALIMDLFGKFHPSEIHLRRLQHVLVNCDVGEENAIEQSRDCLRRLASGAMSGNEYGQLSLLSAAESILQWPNDTCFTANIPPTISQMVLAINAFITTITAVLDKGNILDPSLLIEKNIALQEKLAALEYLDSVLGPGKQLRLTPSFGDFRSPKELFSCLVENGYFLAAESLWKSAMRSKIPTETMVSSILAVNSDVDPRKYSSLLQEVVFPSLTINHELLSPILAWSCQTADSFDDTPRKINGLDDSIFLLSVSRTVVNVCMY